MMSRLRKDENSKAVDSQLQQSTTVEGSIWLERHSGFGLEPNTYDVDYAKIWVPELGKFQYANAKYVEDDDSVSQEECVLSSLRSIRR